MFLFNNNSNYFLFSLFILCKIFVGKCCSRRSFNKQYGNSFPTKIYYTNLVDLIFCSTNCKTSRKDSTDLLTMRLLTFRCTQLIKGCVFHISLLNEGLQTNSQIRNILFQKMHKYFPGYLKFVQKFLVFHRESELQK